ncbi:hypothetical protein [Halorubrum sp. ASP1]|uniref:hypothetical protein n=1 Tax=Halorubrum sp. ASP1 TaxID=2518114 RepID=UPI0013050FAD|nr:hypothetical protein [Halorubrum sp. ASP1]
MDDSSTKIGGDANDSRFIAVYLMGVIIGSVVRTVAWILPDGIVSKVKSTLP